MNMFSSRNSLRVAALCLFGVALHPPAGRAASTSDKRVDFNRDIRPILSDNCFACHGPDEKKRKAKLRLDQPEGAFAAKDGHQAIKPRNLKASELWLRINSKDPDELMPPPDSHKKLKPEQIALFKQWIEQGAAYQGHWSFVPPVQPPVPKAKNARWPRNSIDSFIAQKFEARSLAPAPEAAKEVLIRRVTFDLTGLPPTLVEVDAFLADKSQDAYERLVDRLMQSPHYGEHMARYWLDAARYGDTHGLHLDNERSMWPYRDWVVNAFNRNLPFDQFSIEQLAGDLLPHATRDQLIASGFNRCNVTTSEGGAINEEFLYRYAVDRTETTAAVWMGLTAGCAVCHDHKFDPITSKDFYSMYAFFNNAADPAMDGNALLTPPILRLSTPEQQKQLDAFDKQIRSVEKKIHEAVAKVEYTDPGTLHPPPPLKTIETIWLDDDLPAGAKPQHNVGNHPLTWVTDKDGKVFSGQRALKRTDKGLAQDFFTKGDRAYFLPGGAKIFLHVYLEPEDLPKAVMIQFYTTNWSNRAVWGDLDAIEFGKRGSNERKLMGALPKAGEWTLLEFEAAKLGLKAGAKISGVAFTQFGGTVYWDQSGFRAEVNLVTDPSESQIAWEKQYQGKPAKDFPKDITEIFRSVNPKERKPEHEKKLRDYYLEFVCAGTREMLDPLLKKMEPIKTKRDEFEKLIPATLVMRDMEKPRESFIMVRGQYNKPAERVSPNVPAFLPPLPKTEGATRLDFARWLVDRNHPLTARVTVNRLWQQFFGVGFVKTAGDFGSQGDPPSHPELLDWLATTFMDSGWDVKKLCRLLVSSAAYRQDSRVTAKALQVDRDNRLLARGPRFRLDAEEIRDNALFLSDLLNPAIGGKGVKPYQPENIWEPVAYSGSNTKVYAPDKGQALYRRSLYTFWKRTAPPPAMTTFDAPSRESFCVRRERSNTPLQALLLMNDTQQFEAARHLAQRMMTEGGATPEDRLTFGFRLVTARKPASSEQDILRQTLDHQLAKYTASADAAKKVVSIGESKPPAGLNESELAAYTLVANLLLNLDETLTRN